MGVWWVFFVLCRNNLCLGILAWRRRWKLGWWWKSFSLCICGWKSRPCSGKKRNIRCMHSGFVCYWDKISKKGNIERRLRMGTKSAREFLSCLSFEIACWIVFVAGCWAKLESFGKTKQGAVCMQMQSAFTPWFRYCTCVRRDGWFEKEAGKGSGGSFFAQLVWLVEI